MLTNQFSVLKSITSLSPTLQDFSMRGKKSLKAYSSCVELTEDRMLQRWSGALFEVHL